MHKGSLTMATIWMIVISLILFWLPVMGPLLAGLAGGRVAGTAGRGILAAILPALLLCLLLMALSSSAPLIGAIVSISLFLVIMLQSLPLLIGAVLGGISAANARRGS